MKTKVIVGLSGGVDSAVAALRLVEQGYEVEALFMKNWSEVSPDGNCLWEADVEDAMKVCDVLGIPLNTVDLAREYWERVFAGFLEQYRMGRTPNPDVLCNQEIKFRAFMERALESGADFIATGHYARIEEKDGARQLLKGVDPGKDQSYFLCRLNQQQLGRSLFPLGTLHKGEVRALAARAGLHVHDKKDSTGICFVGERPFREFLSAFLPSRSGPILTADGQQVGEHQGVHFYTLGQRQGLGIGGLPEQGGEPWYVAAKDVQSNTLTVVQGNEHPLLYSLELIASVPHWIAPAAPELPLRCVAKTRYRQRDQSCIVEAADAGRLRVGFREPQRAVTPGQYVVFYQDAVCLGGAVVEKVPS